MPVPKTTTIRKNGRTPVFINFWGAHSLTGERLTRVTDGNECLRRTDDDRERRDDGDDEFHGFVLLLYI